MTSAGGPALVPAVNAQVGDPGAVGFVLDARDLRFIYQQIRIAENHASGEPLFGPGPNQVPEVRLPFGLRTVTGEFNNLVTGQEKFGASDQVFPRMTQPLFKAAEEGTTYNSTKGQVIDSQPRIISNLIADQTMRNPAAVAIAGPEAEPDASGTLFIPNAAPDVGLSAPFNNMFTFFGQFFDHGLDLVNKGGSGTVFVPLQADDPLFVEGSPLNFMALTRATNLPGPDGRVGDDPATPTIDESADDVLEDINQTTPFVDQNQTYTSHPSHQVFLREYEMVGGRPVSTGRFIDGGGALHNIGNWGEVKAQAASMLGIALQDSDVFNAPLIVTDPYGRFLRGTNGFPMVMMQGNVPVEGNPAAPISVANAIRTGHAFLDDIAHNAVPGPGLQPDADSVVNPIDIPAAQGQYDDELLDAHFCTGDGRGNENIALTAVHSVFHAEHNRLRDYIDALIHAPGVLTAAEIAAWEAQAPQPTANPKGSGWGYGERLFQAARFVTEMQYQHLVFEEFARTLAPTINAFIGDGINFHSDTNPAIPAEFAHQAYRLGHSMLTEIIGRSIVESDGTETPADIPLLTGFLNPLAFNNVCVGVTGPGGECDGEVRVLNSAEAAGAIFQGGTRQVGNEIDEFVTEAVRNNLLGLPLDLAVLNLARGRSEGVAPLNSVRRDLYTLTGDPQLLPYESWADFGFSMKHGESLINFIAAYGISPALQSAATADDKRAAAFALSQDPDFMFGSAATTGVENIDLWIGGLAEKIAPFGGMLGTTFNYIFENTLESLQNADRFYYLERLDGLNLLAQMEGNSFAELIARNTTASTSLSASVFGRPDLIFNLDRVIGTDLSGQPIIVDDPTTLDVDERLELTMQPNGTVRYSGPAHVIWNGRAAADSVISSEGDDTIRLGDGNDRMDGGAGNDQPIGGAGDDIITDTFGDDVIKGGPGNDAIAGGSGPFDLLQGNEGHDFVVGGNDASEVFGGSGNDIIYVGKDLTESFGGAGDDWLEGSETPASVLVGDENNQLQNDPDGGHDVFWAGQGDADFDMEGGDDIMVANVLPTHRLEGMLGFDWASYQNEIRAVDADMLITGATAVNAPLNELRDRYDLTEGLSGTKFADLLRGDDRLEAELRDDGLTGVNNGHVLTSAGIGRISGVAALLPAGATEFAGGNIILGGGGSDRIAGRGGDDILDGDRSLRVQLEGTLNNGTVKRANSLHELRPDVFANPQQLNPGNIRIVREIVTTDVSSADVDIAEFQGARGEYTISVNANGSITVAHTAPVGNVNDGVDTLWNIEQIQFTNQTVSTTGLGGTPVPNVQGLSLQAAQQLLVQRGLTPGTVSNANANTIAFGLAIGTDPIAGVGVQPGSTVNIVMSLGPSIPDVHDTTVEDAAAELALSGLVVGNISEAFNEEIPAGLIATQSPLPGGVIAPGGAVDLFLSKGPAPVGLVMSLSFDTGTATDISGNDNHGTINGAVAAPGRVGPGALRFDGVNDMVVVPNSDSLGLETGMTLEAWVNPSARTGWHTVMLKEGTGTFAYEMYSNNPEINRPAAYFMDEAGALRAITGTAALPLNTWSHLATTWDGTTMRLYVNGVQVRSALRAGPMLATDGQLSIGGNLVWGGEFFAGMMDEVKIYDRALTAAEIQSDMNGDPLPAPANNAPTAAADTLSTSAGSSVAFTEAALLANDTDGDADPVEVLSVSALSTNGGSITTNSEGSWVYTPPAGFAGTDTFTYTISDGRGGSANGTVTVTVTGASSGLVLALGFNEAPGATTATDSSGRNNNATTGGATFVASGRTGGGNALSFDGVNDMATVADSNSLDLSSTFTLEAWVRPANSTGWRTVLLKEAGAQMAYELYSNDATANRPAGHFTTPGGAIRSATGTATLAVNAWSHIAVTYDGTNMRVYVNGALVRTVARTGAVLASDGVLHLGGNVVWGGEFFQGLMDDVRIYNRALSGGEITTDMNTPIVP